MLKEWTLLLNIPLHLQDLPTEVIIFNSAILFELTDNNNTQIKVSDEASPLRVSREELGRFGWTFLHSIAAAYPEKPTDNDKLQLRNFINALYTYINIAQPFIHARTVLVILERW